MDESNKKFIYDATAEEIQVFLEKTGLPAYRFKQVESWLDRGVDSVAAMNNLPKTLRDALADEYRFSAMECVQEQLSQEDGTRKFVFRLADGNIVECVYMEYHYGASVCVSSQAGCRMGCSFCASTKAGFARNLSSGEMLAQVQAIAAVVPRRISHVVVMGIGEPFENYDNLMTFLHALHKPSSFNISYRSMTVSSCGLIPEMLKFSNERLPVTLAVSLHAANDDLRQSLMPIARRYPLKDLIAACRVYTERTKRRISFEYALFKDVNDSPAHAKELANLLKSMLCHVNLIPANPFPGSAYKTSDMRTIKEFQKILDDAHIPCSVRRSLGRDIMAACGQLRRRMEE